MLCYFAQISPFSSEGSVGFVESVLVPYLQLMATGSDGTNTAFGTSRELDAISAGKLQQYLQQT